MEQSNKKEKSEMVETPSETAENKKAQSEIEKTKKQESRMMNFFNQEFIERNIDFKPKKNTFDQKHVTKDLRKILNNAEIYERLISLEKTIDEKMYKMRLDVQEDLLMPTPKVKALLRTQIFSFFSVETETKEMEVEEAPEGKAKKLYFNLRIQGKVMKVLANQSSGFTRKFSHFLNKVIIKFDHDNEENFEEIWWDKWKNPAETDGFEIKRRCNLESEIKIKISFYLNYSPQEYKLSPAISSLLGIKQATRPKILNHFWQYVKLNSLQDKENSNLILNNKELQSIFGAEKMEISHLTGCLLNHLSAPDPVEVEYTIRPHTQWKENQKLFDIEISIDDPHFLSISNFLSNLDNESILFPKSMFFSRESQQKGDKSQTYAENFYSKIGEYEKTVHDLNEKLKKHKYKHDFYEAFAKDPSKFIKNFLIQENSLLRIMREESSIIDARWDYNSAQYYKDYEEILREHTENYLEKTKKFDK